MDNFRKPIWVEGIFLSQQHFQEWDQYLESQQKLRVQSMAPFLWGLQTLSIDEDALDNGQFRIKQLQGIMSSGQIVHYQFSEPTILSRMLNAESNQKIDIYLGLPISPKVNGVTGYHDQQGLAMWQADYQQVDDCYDSNRTREVLFGRLNLCLLNGDENCDQFYTIKIAEVTHQGNNKFECVKTFIPTCTHIKTSSYLQQLLNRMIEQVSARIRLLTERRERYREGHEYGHADLDHFLLLQVLSESLPILKHFQAHQDTHPVALYLKFAQLLGSLSPFTSEFNLSSLQAYNHRDLTKTFIQITNQLEEVLSFVMPKHLSALKLRRDGDTMYKVDVIDSSLFNKSRFFIAVYFQSENTDWIDQFSRQVKIGTINVIDDILASALPGVKVIHTQRPPNRLPVKTGYEYFYIENTGHFWEQIQTERNLAIFIPHVFINAEIDLVSLQE